MKLLNMRFGAINMDFIVDKNGRAVSYYGENSVESIMNQLSLYYPYKEYSEGHLIALNDGVLFITLEPAAQIETSIIPVNDLFKIEAFPFISISS